jgi:large-conductance mechanosensitive channel
MAQQSLLLTFAVAIFVGNALKDFFNAFITNLVMPFLVVLFPSGSGVGDFVLEFGPIKLKVGDALAAGGTLVVALFVAAMAMPYLKEYSPVQGGRR